MQSVTVPALRSVRQSARVKLNGRWHYLGPTSDPAVVDRYNALVSAWLANGRQLPALLPGQLLVRDIADRYLHHCEHYYRKGDRVTSSALRARRVLELLAHRFGDLPASDFTPQHLRSYQRWLCTLGCLSRGTINEYTSVTRALFGWARAEGLIPAGVFAELSAVPDLRRGRSPAPGVPAPPDGRVVTPVPEDVLQRTLAVARPMIRAMIRLQLATGMRPGELVALRPCHLRPTSRPDVMAYLVPADANKLDHLEHARTVWIGPCGLAILRPLLPSDPRSPVFSPAVALADHLAARSAMRKSPRWPSHSREARRRRRNVLGLWGPSESYSVASYRRAITRACRAAHPHPDLSRVPVRRLTAEQREELERWHASHAWHPHQLRHNAASYIAEHESLEVAGLLLGHSRLETTMRYVKVRDERAVLAALRHG